MFWTIEARILNYDLFHFLSNTYIIQFKFFKFHNKTFTRCLASEKMQRATLIIGDLPKCRDPATIEYIKTEGPTFSR